jgi:hypothetical protein
MRKEEIQCDTREKGGLGYVADIQAESRCRRAWRSLKGMLSYKTTMNYGTGSLRDGFNNLGARAIDGVGTK